MSLNPAPFASAGSVAEAGNYLNEDLEDYDDNDERDFGVSRYGRGIVCDSNSPFYSDLGENEPRIVEASQPTNEDVREVAGLHNLGGPCIVISEQAETRLLVLATEVVGLRQQLSAQVELVRRFRQFYCEHRRSAEFRRRQLVANLQQYAIDCDEFRFIAHEVNALLVAAREPLNAQGFRDQCGRVARAIDPFFNLDLSARYDTHLSGSPSSRSSNSPRNGGSSEEDLA